MLPYIFITWEYYCKKHGEYFEVNENLRNAMYNTIYLHITANRHHPEFHDPTFNRDSMYNEKIVICERMSDIDIAEMCADWMVMCEEKDVNYPAAKACWVFRLGVL